MNSTVRGAEQSHGRCVGVIVLFKNYYLYKCLLVCLVSKSKTHE